MIPNYKMFPEGLPEWELNVLISLDSISRETDELIELLLKDKQSREDTTKSINEALEAINEAHEAYQKALNELGN